MQPHQSQQPDPALIVFLEDYLRKALQEQFREQMEAFVRTNEQRAQEFSLLERIVRVEEELKALRELDAIRFEAMEKRFDAMQDSMDKRFDAMDKRFEAMDKRFEVMQDSMDKRFDALTRRLDRFMIWSLGLTVSATALIISVLK